METVTNTDTLTWRQSQIQTHTHGDTVTNTDTHTWRQSQVETHKDNVNKY